MTRIIDLSPRLTPSIAVWPGDVPLVREVAMSFAGGDHLELSALRATVHLGAHADAPSHYHRSGQDIAERPLDRYYGPCEVMWVRVQAGARILPRDLPYAPSSPRVLLRTGTFLDPERFDTDFASLSPELVEHLADLGVVLVGIDTPSVDPFSSKQLESHQALFRRDVAVLEGLVLEQAPPGPYTLVALPLRLVGFDASPVRAALISPS